jgi:sterol desaturase/sphingolipid hydroxylase (fatty acid hydroxylase superfamily)
VPVLSDPQLLVRLGVFVGVMLTMALWETMAPRRGPTRSKPRRWSANLGLQAINAVVMRVAAPFAATATALVAGEHGWGPLQSPQLPFWAAVVLAVIALDLAVYLQHVLFHAVPALWRLHRLHHADADMDVTTGVRFHTVEVLLSMGIKSTVVAALGAPALSVLIFEAILNATSMFNHADVRMPRWLDRVLRLFLVTPDMHRVHHSTDPAEANRNFGFNLPWWDYLAGTYRAQPARGHEGMTIGPPTMHEEHAPEPEATPALRLRPEPRG